MNSKQIHRLLRVAYPMCLDISRPKKHISVILHKGRIEAIGSNQVKTHPLAVKHGYMFGEPHSELDAFLRLDNRKQRLSLFNIRFNRFGQMRMARPCFRCMPWCVVCFDEIWYTTNEGVILHDEGISSINTCNTRETLNEKIYPIS